MTKLRHLLILFTIFTFFMTTGFSGKAEEEKSFFNPDKNISPADDFYLHVNNNWLKNNSMPDHYSRYGAFEQLNEENEQKIYDLVIKIKNDTEASEGSNRQKIRDFYISALDTQSLNRERDKPLKPLLKIVDNIKSKNDIAEVTAKLHSMGIRPFFGMGASQDRRNSERMIAYVSQGGLGMSDRDYYLKEGERNREIKEGYVDFIEKTFNLAGYSSKEATNKAENILKIETALAEASMDRLTLRNPLATYNKITTTELKEISPQFNWTKYFNSRGVSFETLNAGQPNFLKKVSTLLDETPIEKLKDYIKWNIYNSSATYLSSDFNDASFAFYGKTMTGTSTQRERWKRVLSVINSNIGEALGQEYVKLYFPEENKERMTDLVEHLRLSFKERIKDLEWMEEKTKEHALEKLASMNVKIGYPDKWTSYEKLSIKKQPYIKNVWEARSFNINENLKKIGEPVDRDEWFMNPQTVNAYYHPVMNEIVFPAAILQPPFFYPNGDDAINYGAIGMVIGHEMTHGFDDQGRRYASDGNMTDWWSEKDSKRFETKSKVLVEQYNNYVVLDSLTINGELSLGENIADLGGLSIAYQALQNKLEEDGRPDNINGLTPEQRFFISYAKVWRSHIRDQRLMQQINEGPHSPGEARVNGIVYNMEQFYEAFNIKNGKRYIEPSNRTKIW
ncbi:M13 family metallopeptidase [Marinilabiliaceae bacterium ANBcel2]|nr:M13 family metallopeptidase [Marinilabiliaceae bacterium ANBcel2]